MIDILTCPVAECGEECYGSKDLREHVYDHSAGQLADTVVELTKAVASAKANTECQICGNYGASPGDHPLCDDCESEVRG